MMQRFRRFLPFAAIIAALLLIVALPMTAFADAGDYAGDHNYGGGGGSDDDSDGGWIIYIVIQAFKWVYRAFGWKGVLVLAVILLIVGCVWKFVKKKAQPVLTGAQPTDRSTLAQMYSYRQLDTAFDEAAFREKLSNLYVQLQNAWQDKNLESMRPYMTDAVYAQFDRQLEAYRRNNQTNYIERIAVLSTDLLGWKQEAGKDVIIAELRTRIVDYVKDDSTGAIVRGSNTQEKFMTYEWTLVRTSGQTTGQTSGMTGQTCPNCGAHIDINHTAVCEYCGTVLTSDTFDWVVSNIKGLSQQTR